MIIQKVKEYHKEQLVKYNKEVDKWNYSTGGFPCLAIYLFIKDNGTVRQRGFVISEGNSHYFKLTKKEVDKFILEKCL